MTSSTSRTRSCSAGRRSSGSTWTASASPTEVDEIEDGGRATVIEEGVAAFAFAYAARHEFLDGVTRLDQQFLDSIVLMTHGLEVGSRKHADFELAIVQGFNVFRPLHENNGGLVDFDADARELTYRPRQGQLGHGRHRGGRRFLTRIRRW